MLFSYHRQIIAWGTVAYLVTTVLLSHILAPEEFSAFALLMLYATYLMSFGLLGLDNSIIRLKPRLDACGKMLLDPRITKSEFVVGAGVSLCGTVFLSHANDFPLVSTTGCMVLIFSTSCIYLLRNSGHARATGNVSWSAFLLQGWRFSLMIVIALALLIQGAIQQMYLLVLIGIAPILIFGIVKHRIKHKLRGDFDLHGFIINGLLISASNVSFVLTTTIDRWWANGYYPAEIAAKYLFNVTLILGPFSLLQSLIGFALLPRLLQATDDTLKVMVTREIWIAIFLSGILAVVIYGSYRYGAGIIYPKFYYDHNLLVLCILSALIRPVYSVYSAVIGARGTSDDLFKSQLYGWLVTAVLLCFLIFLDGASIYFMAWAVIIATAMRLFLWRHLANHIIILSR